MDTPAAAAAGGSAVLAQAVLVSTGPEELLRARLVRARFEALVEWGVPVSDAREIAQVVTVDIVDAVELLRAGCPPEFVLPILA